MKIWETINRYLDTPCCIVCIVIHTNNPDDSSKPMFPPSLPSDKNMTLTVWYFGTQSASNNPLAAWPDWLTDYCTPPRGSVTLVILVDWCPTWCAVTAAHLYFVGFWSHYLRLLRDMATTEMICGLRIPWFAPLVTVRSRPVCRGSGPWSRCDVHPRGCRFRHTQNHAVKNV